MTLQLKTLTLVVMLAIGVANPTGQSPVLRMAMREKLANAQGLLETVVLGDYAAVARYTERLSRISETEIALWQTTAEPEYSVQAARFLLAVQAL